MPDLPKVRQEYEADTRGYSGNLREAAKDADRFSDKNNKAALAARKMGLTAKEAADKAAKSMSLAGEAAEKLAMGEIKADEAAQAEARALKDAERAAIAAAEADRALARAADEAADQMRQLNREATLAAAASHLAALREVGDTKSYNEALKSLRKTHGDLTGTALEGFQEMQDKGSTTFRTLNAAGAQLAKAGPLWVVGTANAIALLPEAAAVAGEGLTVVLGGALAGIGLKAQAGYADVRRTFSRLKTDVGGDLKEISGPFHETWIRLAADADHAFHELEPSLQDTFGRMAPAVSHFESTIISGLSGPRVQAAIASIGRSFGPILDKLGPATAGAIGDVADGIKSISDAAAANPGALSGLVTGIGQITKATAEGVGFLIRYKTGIENVVMMASGGGPLGLYKLVTSLNAGTRAILGVDDGFKQAERTFPTFSQEATAAAAASGHLMTANQAAALSADQLKTAMDGLTAKTLNQRESMIAYRESVAQLTKTLKENGAAHGFNTAKGRENEQALDAVAAKAQAAAQGMKADGKSAREVSAYLEGARRTLIAAAEKMGYSSTKARELASQLLGVTHAANTIPSGKRITLSSNASAEARRINAMRSALDRLHNKTITITTYYQQVEAAHHAAQAERARQAAGGLVGFAGGGYAERYYPDGGQVSGPGTSTSDSIPAMLSNGEFVVNAKQTAKWLPILEEINQGVNGFKIGGTITGQTPAQSAGAERVNIARARPEYLAALAAQNALAAMRNTVYGGYFRGGPSTLGSAHGSVVQHVTTVNVHVAGSIRSDRELAQVVQQQLITNRMPVSLPGGRL